jgi:transcriptional regulator with XRE-family HTH domain
MHPMKAQEFLKQSRKALGFTLKGLAQASGYDICDIKNYEYGRARVPGDLVLQLQAMLEVQNKREKPTRKSEKLETA